MVKKDSNQLIMVRSRWHLASTTSEEDDLLDLKDDIAIDRDILESLLLTFISLPMGFISSSHERKEPELSCKSSKSNCCMEVCWGIIMKHYFMTINYPMPYSQ